MADYTKPYGRKFRAKMVQRMSGQNQKRSGPEEGIDPGSPHHNSLLLS